MMAVKQRMLGPYEVLEEIGVGGMATVYRGRGPKGASVAIKVLSTQMAANPVVCRRFEQEFRAARQLQHPNIVRGLDFGQSESGPFFVMEFVAGESMGQRLQREGALPQAEAVALIGQVAQALAHAHEQGVIHRDVKPDNILITDTGDARLTDFGLAKQLAHDQDLTAPGQGLGTPNFIAPEQLLNAKAIDHRCDVYGLGATLYAAVTGCNPFAGRSLMQTIKKKANNELVLPRQMKPELSEALELIIRRALQPDPGQRQASCTEFHWELTQLNLSAAPTPSQRSARPDQGLIPTVITNPADVAAPTNRATIGRWLLAGAFVLGMAAGTVIALCR